MATTSRATYIGPRHTVYRYTIGAKVTRTGNASGMRGVAAAKCSCGAELVGGDQVADHIEAHTP